MDYPEIIQRCLKGDRVAQKALFDRFAGRMIHVCRRYAVDDTEAQDMVQESFIRVFENLSQFRNSGPFEGWVHRIFINTAIKQYHRTRKHHAVDEIQSAFMTEADIADAFDTMSEQELIGLLSELPDGYRVVFNLYAIEGYSHAEIAAMLSIRESTSRSQLVKARKVLQTKVMKLQTIPG